MCITHVFYDPDTRIYIFKRSQNNLQIDKYVHRFSLAKATEQDESLHDFRHKENIR